MAFGSELGLIRFNCFKGLCKNSFYPSNLISNATYFKTPFLILVLLPQSSYCALVDTYLIQAITSIVFYLIPLEVFPLLPLFRNLEGQVGILFISVSQAYQRPGTHSVEHTGAQ